MTKNLVADLRSLAPSLRPSERRVADAIILNPTAVLDLTITQLSKLCQTSVASVARFARNAGFSGYSDFRLELASSIGREEVSLDRFGVSDSNITADDTLDEVLAKIAFHEGKAIEATAVSIDRDALEAVASAITKAPRVEMFGVASSGLAASDLQHKLHRIGMVAYAWNDLHLALTSAALLSPGCVAVGFSHTGLTVETADMLDVARAAGATTVLVTNSPASPIARSVDYVLTTSASETQYRPGAMAGRIAQLAIIDFLFVRIMQGRTAPSLQSTYEAIQAHRLSYPRRRAGS